MNIEERIKKINGTITVQIDGFFTERYINLCKINNIKIWDIQVIVNGIVRFNIAIKDFKKLKSINKKTKCKVKIIKKEGMYFKIHKYKKRKIALILLIIAIISTIIFNSFIWNISITGNTYIKNSDVEKALKDSGIYVGKIKIGLNEKEILSGLRVNLPDIAWIGLDISGTKANINIVEKTKLGENNDDSNLPGDILTSKSGIIKKIVAENGTAIQNVGDYIEKDRIVIEGKMYSKTMEPKDVHAKGYIIINTKYEFSKEYSFIEEVKEYNLKDKYTIGLSINNNENYINYLDKSLKYDIIKSSYNMHIFGQDVSFGVYKLKPYTIRQTNISKEDILIKAKVEADEYVKNDVLTNTQEGIILSSNVEILSENDECISLKVIYEVEEKVGYFKERKNYE